MSAHSNFSVEQRAADISGKFGEMGVDVPASTVQERIAAMQEFSVPLEEATTTTVRNLAAEYDLDDGDLSEDVSALAGFSGDASGSHAFERVMLGDIAEVGPEEWVDVRAQVVDLWEPKHDSMRQVGLIGDESAQMKFVVWQKNTESRDCRRGRRRTHRRQSTRDGHARRPRRRQWPHQALPPRGLHSHRPERPLLRARRS